MPATRPRPLRGRPISRPIPALPAAWGRRNALLAAAGLHGIAFGVLCNAWQIRLRTPASLAWLAAIGVVFLWQHAVAERKPEFAFFTLNGLIGFLVFGMVLAGIR